MTYILPYQTNICIKKTHLLVRFCFDSLKTVFELLSYDMRRVRAYVPDDLKESRSPFIVSIHSVACQIPQTCDYARTSEAKD
jgi:hypothetical protein